MSQAELDRTQMQRHKALVRRLYAECINEGNVIYRIRDGMIPRWRHTRAGVSHPGHRREARPVVGG